MMEVVATSGAIRLAKLQSDHHQQQTNTQFFYRPDALPTVYGVRALTEKYHIQRNCSPQAHLGDFQLCL